MTRRDIVTAICKKVPISKKEVTEILKELIGFIHRTLAKGGRVRLSDLGVFSVRKQAARLARNPQTNQKFKIAAKKVPKFRASLTLKNLLLKKGTK
jgi:DNA-binding protein HU-beta